LILVKRERRPETKLESNPCPNVPTMSENRFAEFRAQLQAQRAQLLGEVREKIAASGEGLGLTNQSKITDDDGLADAAAEMDIALVRRESRELRDIEAALTRMDAGSYGSCADCGDEIGQARLQAYPAAMRCVSCQEKFEHAQNQIHKAGL
jgi:DnaK suppressor protein